MINETKKAFAVAALIVATGVVAVELTRSSAQAESTIDVALRIDTAFAAAATMPPVQPVRVPMATKGDLPVPFACFGIPAEAQAECMDVVYEVPSEPSVVVETRHGATSTLTRMEVFTLAELATIFDNRTSE